jgi:hypothetical protein
MGCRSLHCVTQPVIDLHYHWLLHPERIGRIVEEHAMLTLVVEDDAVCALPLADELELSGHLVVGPARSSGEALALVRARRRKLALID